jgi:hypothetical protein
MANPPGAAVLGSPFPQWFIDTAAGSAKTPDKVTNSVTKAVAISVAFPDKLVFFTSQAAAQAYANGIGGSHAVLPSGVTGTGQDILNDAGSTVQDAATVPEFLGRLEEGQTWLRVAEVILGGVLLIVALKAMTDPVTAPIRNTVKSGTRTAAKVGAFF